MPRPFWFGSAWACGAAGAADAAVLAGGAVVAGAFAPPPWLFLLKPGVMGVAGVGASPSPAFSAAGVAAALLLLLLLLLLLAAFFLLAARYCNVLVSDENES